MKKPLVILGTARKNSNTGKLVAKVLAHHDHQLVDLMDYEIAPYNYEETYPEGDGFEEVLGMMEAAEVVIFATPVYWYSMSGVMKDFFDRMTDFLDSDRWKLKGKRMFLIYDAAHPTPPEGFEVPFRDTAGYLGMEYGGALFADSSRQDWQTLSSPEEEKFVQNLLAAQSQT